MQGAKNLHKMNIASFVPDWQLTDVHACRNSTSPLQRRRAFKVGRGRQQAAFMGGMDGWMRSLVRCLSRHSSSISQYLTPTTVESPKELYASQAV
jgi:hypothetical protein